MDERNAERYIKWLRDMADRETMMTRPCPKALRRAADAWEADRKELEQLRQHAVYE